MIFLLVIALILFVVSILFLCHLYVYLRSVPDLLNDISLSLREISENINKNAK